MVPGPPLGRFHRPIPARSPDGPCVFEAVTQLQGRHLAGIYVGTGAGADFLLARFTDPAAIDRPGLSSRQVVASKGAGA